MALRLFTTTATYKSVNTDMGDEGSEPDIQNITATVKFEPSIKEAVVDGVTYRLNPIIGRINEDGLLRTIYDDLGVKLVCGDALAGEPLHGLSYLVTFSNVVYNKQRNQPLNPIRFLAPLTETTVDLADVTRLPLR